MAQCIIGHTLFNKLALICAELGYKFMNDMVKNGTTFTRFCEEVTEVYQGYNPLLVTFTSVHTFIDWFFQFSACQDRV